jgi:hypothetical protein
MILGEHRRPSRLMKNAHLRRYPHSSSLRCTSMYASPLGISDALHLDVFDSLSSRCFSATCYWANCTNWHEKAVGDKGINVRWFPGKKEEHG